MKLPSRAGAIWAMVLGGVMAIVIAPSIFIGIIMGGLDWNSLVTGSSTVTNGAQVTVDESGTIALVSEGTESLTACTLTSGSQSVQLSEESGSGLMVGRDVPAGTYTVDCGVSQDTSIFVLRGDDLTGIISATQRAITWATVVGIVGIGVFIAGVVWLVQRNRQRREVLRSQWGGGMPGGYVR